MIIIIISSSSSSSGSSGGGGSSNMHCYDCYKLVVVVVVVCGFVRHRPSPLLRGPAVRFIVAVQGLSLPLDARKLFVLTDYRKEAKASFPSPLSGPCRLSSRLAVSRNDEHPCSSHACENCVNAYVVDFVHSGKRPHDELDDF